MRHPEIMRFHLGLSPSYGSAFRSVRGVKLGHQVFGKALVRLRHESHATLRAALAERSQNRCRLALAPRADPPGDAGLGSVDGFASRQKSQQPRCQEPRPQVARSAVQMLSAS